VLCCCYFSRITAALNDAIAWCLLILAISIANAGDLITAFYVFLCVIGVGLGLFFLIKPIFAELVIIAEKADASPLLKGNLFAFTMILLFLCSWTLALLGVDAIFGAFLFGLIIPVSRPPDFSTLRCPPSSTSS